MRGKLWFIGGLAAGFVLGARSGRETYEQLVVKGRKVLDHPTVQEAAGVAQAQATRLYTEGRDKLSQTRLGEKLHVSSSTDNTKELTPADTALAGATSGASRTTGTSTASATTEPRAKSPGSNTNGSTA